MAGELDLGRIAGRLELDDQFTSPLVRLVNTVLPQLATVLTGPIGQVTALATATAALASHAITAGDELSDFSEKLGLSAEAASELKYVGQVTDRSLESLAATIFMLQRRMSLEPGAFSKGLKEIHLTLQEIQGLAPEQQFFKIAEAFRTYTDSTNRATVATDLFSRSGRDAIPLLMKPVQELAERAKDLGHIMGQDALNATVEWHMAWNAFKADLEWTTSSAGLAVMRWFQDLKNLTIIDENTGKSRIKEAEDAAAARDKANTLAMRLRAMSPSERLNLAMDQRDQDLNERRIAYMREFELPLANLQPKFLPGYVSGDDVSSMARQTIALAKLNEVMDKHTESMRVQVMTQLILTGSIKDTADSLRLSEGQVKLVDDEMKIYSALMEESATNTQELEKVQSQFWKGPTAQSMREWAIRDEQTRGLTPLTSRSFVSPMTSLNPQALTQAQINQNAKAAKRAQEMNAGIGVDNDLGGSISDTWRNFFQHDLSQGIIRAAEGGGNAFRTVGTSLGQTLGTSLSKAFKINTDTMWGSLASGLLTAGVGAAIGILFSKLFDDKPKTPDGVPALPARPATIIHLNINALDGQSVVSVMPKIMKAIKFNEGGDHHTIIRSIAAA